MGFEGFEGQGLRARLCCRRHLTPYFGYITLPHVDWPAQCLAQRKPKRNIQKEKIEIDKRRKHFFYTFLYLLCEGPNRRYCPKHQTAKWCCWFDGHCLKEKDNMVSFFFQEEYLLSFTHASSPFPLETSGSFLKFNSFLFIYLFIFFKFNFLFIYSFPTNVCKQRIFIE